MDAVHIGTTCANRGLIFEKPPLLKTFTITREIYVLIHKLFSRFSFHLIFVLKVWNGKEVEDSIEGVHRTVSMTWGEECDVEMRFFRLQKVSVIDYALTIVGRMRFFS